MRTVQRTAKSSKKKSSSSRYVFTPEQISHDLLYSCRELRYEIADAMSFIEDIEAEAKRVARLGKER
jgi:hypothetical protein